MAVYVVTLFLWPEEEYIRGVFDNKEDALEACKLEAGEMGTCSILKCEKGRTYHHPSVHEDSPVEWTPHGWNGHKEPEPEGF